MSKIETIFTHGKGVMGIDSKGRLYWNNKLVVTENKISFSWWVNLAVALGSIATVIMGIISILEYFKPDKCI